MDEIAVYEWLLAEARWWAEWEHEAALEEPELASPFPWQAQNIESPHE